MKALIFNQATNHGRLVSLHHLIRHTEDFLTQSSFERMKNVVHCIIPAALSILASLVAFLENKERTIPWVSPRKHALGWSLLFASIILPTGNTAIFILATCMLSYANERTLTDETRGRHPNLFQPLAT